MGTDAGHHRSGWPGLSAKFPVAPATGRAIDISNYSGIPTVKQFQQAKAEGFDLVIVGTQDATIATAQYSNALLAGLRAEAYIFLDWTGDLIPQLRDALAIEFWPRLWLDVEAVKGSSTSLQIVEELHEAWTYCENLGQQVGIYTSRSKWRTLTDDWHDFGQLPLWDAWYFHPNIDDFTPYGGWDSCAMRQFKADATVAGINVDLNTYRV